MREQSDIQTWQGASWESGQKPDNMQALEAAILEDAEEQVRQIMADAQAQVQSIRQQAEEQAKASQDVILERARQEASVLQSQAIAAARMEAQTIQLQRRERLLSQVFARVREQLQSIPQRPDYREIAHHLLREAVARLNAAELLVRTDAQTRQILDDAALAELGNELNVRLLAGEPLARGVGVSVETTDRHRRYDNTLETRLARTQDSLRTLVYRILMGEQE